MGKSKGTFGPTRYISARPRILRPTKVWGVSASGVRSSLGHRIPTGRTESKAVGQSQVARTESLVSSFQRFKQGTW